MRISRDARKTGASAAHAIRFAAIPIAVLSVHGSALTAPASTAATAKATAAPSAAAVHLPKVPGLRISIGDGRTTAQAGDQLTYTVLLQNSGARRSPRLEITQTLPPGLRFVSASRHGVAKAGSVTWYADLPAGGKDTFRLQAQVTQPATRQSRLAAVACAALAGSRTPIICAAHLDRLPGAAAAASGRRAATPAASTLPSYAVGVLAVLAVAAIAIVAGRRVRIRRRRAG